MPVLQRWPHFAEATARSAALCRTGTAAGRDVADELASSIAADGAGYRAAGDEPDARRAAMLRRWLAGRQCRDAVATRPERLWDEVALAREDAGPCVHLAGFDVRRCRNCGGLNQPVKRTSVQLDWPDWLQPLNCPVRLGRVRLMRSGDMRPPWQTNRSPSLSRQRRHAAYCRAPRRTQAEENLAGAGRAAVAARHHAAAVLRRNADCCGGTGIHHKKVKLKMGGVRVRLMWRKNVTIDASNVASVNQDSLTTTVPISG